MKKRLLVSIILMLFVIGVSSAFAGVLMHSYSAPSKQESAILPTYEINYVPYGISTGDVCKRYVIDSKIDVIDDTNEIITFETNKKLLNKGDLINKNQTIGSYISNFCGRVLDVTDLGDKERIKAVNYLNKKIICFIDSNQLSVFKYGQSYKVLVGSYSCIARISYIDVLLEESDVNNIKVELTLDEESLFNNDNLFLINGSSCFVCYKETIKTSVLRCSIGAFDLKKINEGSNVRVLIKRKDGDFFVSVLKIGLIGDEYIELEGNIEQGDVVCA